ncbi:hypothetical protein IAR55_002841 [Kwoniella newhampshirensis]|uniref:Peroxin-19 n=1 Tax=Kwoniella newhampshirensis TaxID=1651941 RepID=A0AAW0Z086_9TREE
MSQPSNVSGSSSYRNPTVDDDDEDDDEDLSDLDDVLASFNETRPATTTTSTSPKVPLPSSSSAPAATRTTAASAAPVGDEEDFEASLMEGMESLLRQLAGDHPPGPMADSKTKPPDSSNNNNQASGSGMETGGQVSKEAEEEAWQKAVEMVLSGEGLSALGLDEKGETQASSSMSTFSAVPGGPGGEPRPKASYEETLRKTMESLNAGGQRQPSTSAGGDGPDLAALLASLGGDTDLLKVLNLNGLGDGEDGDGDGEDGDLAGVLEGMMAQLMTKEVLEEPMAELAAKYPPYLASPPSGTSPADLEKYTNQHILVQRITQTFKKADYSDEKDGKEIARLVSEMQDLGGPPKEVMGDLPEGFDLGALGGDEGCTIM